MDPVCKNALAFSGGIITFPLSNAAIWFISVFFLFISAYSLMTSLKSSAIFSNALINTWFCLSTISLNLSGFVKYSIALS